MLWGSLASARRRLAQALERRRSRGAVGENMFYKCIDKSLYKKDMIVGSDNQSYGRIIEYDTDIVEKSAEYIINSTKKMKIYH